MRHSAARVGSGAISLTRWKWALVYPSRDRHRFPASLFPKNYGRFLLVGLVGKVVFLLALTYIFVVFAAFAAGRYDQAVLYTVPLPLAGIGFAVYNLLTDLNVRISDRQLRPVRPTFMAGLLLALAAVSLLETVPLLMSSAVRQTAERIDVVRQRESLLLAVHALEQALNALPADQSTQQR